MVVALAVSWAALRWVSEAARRVSGASMEPTLRAGQLVLTVPASDRLAVGDVVVVRDPRARERLTVKRIVALAGDVADLPGGPAPVPPGHVAVAGDHRGRSTDSRHYGAVPAALVVRRVLLRLLPPGRMTRRRPTGGGPRSPG
ncbi:MAG: S26 family signal peptidase [Actinomycetota bacterium]|nr:S26 family signal peptidase [Actinomycetota bacterium]